MINESLSSPSIELKLRPTSITIKKGTKDLLDLLGTKNESYDDVIRRLVRELHDYEGQLKKLPAKNLNKAYFSTLKRKSSSLPLDTKKIFFEHNIPQKPLDYFRFDIYYTKIVIENSETAIDRYANPLEMAEDYLHIYEKLLKTYIDPLFKVDSRRLLSLEWWKQKIISLGLSIDTYESDIEEKLIHLGVLP